MGREGEMGTRAELTVADLKQLRSGGLAQRFEEFYKHFSYWAERLPYVGSLRAEAALLAEDANKIRLALDFEVGGSEVAQARLLRQKEVKIQNVSFKLRQAEVENRRLRARLQILEQAAQQQGDGVPSGGAGEAGAGLPLPGQSGAAVGAEAYAAPDPNASEVDERSEVKHYE